MLFNLNRITHITYLETFKCIKLLKSVYFNFVLKKLISLAEDGPLPIEQWQKRKQDLTQSRISHQHFDK